MVKKTLTFTDFNGDKVTKDFYFNINKMEFRDLDKKIPGGIQLMLDQVQSERNLDRFVDLLSSLILESYGENVDGRFVKTDKYGRRLSDYFAISEAWDILFMNLFNSPEELVEFLSGIIPKDMSDQFKDEVKKQEAAQAANVPALVE